MLSGDLQQFEFGFSWSKFKSGESYSVTELKANDMTEVDSLAFAARRVPYTRIPPRAM